MTVSYGRFTAKAGTGVRLDRDEALRYLGYAGQQVDDALLARFHALAQACERDIEPTYAWGVFDIDVEASCFENTGCEKASRSAEGAATPDGRSVASVNGAASSTCEDDEGLACDGGASLAGSASCAGEAAVSADAFASLDGLPCVALKGCELVLSGSDIARHLAGAGKVALMACTLGMESEREYRRLAAVSPADGAMFGSCCSALVEAAANAVEGQVIEVARREGMVTNWRYSPGYGDLPLDVQPAFLDALDATRRLGINVTPTNMLVPVKSVTAVIGLFDKESAGFDGRADETCASCPAAGDCDFKKRGTTCHG